MKRTIDQISGTGTAEIAVQCNIAQLPQLPPPVPPALPAIVPEPLVPVPAAGDAQLVHEAERGDSALAGADAWDMPTPPSMPSDTANGKMLREQGYCVFPMGLSRSKIIMLTEAMEHHMRVAPEMSNYWRTAGKAADPVRPPATLGGFAASGLPSVFHAPPVRALRKVYDARMQSLLQDEPGECSWQQLPDRYMFRRAGQQPVKEHGHRDISPALADGTRVFGGWINLDMTDQFAHLCPGTHVMSTGARTGFAPIRDVDQPCLRRLKERIVIPPGHAIVFEQQIVHFVNATKAPHDMHRLFAGGVLYDCARPQPIMDLGDFLDNGAAPTLPSGQRPPLYAQNHASYNFSKRFMARPGVAVDGLPGWSKAFTPVCLQDVTRKSGKHAGRQFRVVRRFLPSLREMGMFVPEYGRGERDMFVPTPLCVYF